MKVTADVGGREGSGSPVRTGVFPAALIIFATALAPFFAAQPAAGSPPDGIYIAAFYADPAELIVPYGSEQGRATLNLTLHNGRQDPCNITVTFSENGRAIETRDLAIAGNTSLNLSIPWSIRGAGVHRAMAALSSGNETEPSNMTATCEMISGRPVMNPSPWYTIPCAFLFIIIPSLAIWLFIRRMKGGDWLERWAKR